MAGVNRRRADHGRTLANDSGCASDGDRSAIAGTDPDSNGDAASSHSHGAANQHAIAATDAVADAGTADYCTIGNPDPTDRHCNRCAVANYWCDRSAIADRSTGSAVANRHGDRRAACAADRGAAGDAATACADGGARRSAAAAVALLW